MTRPKFYTYQRKHIQRIDLIQCAWGTLTTRNMRQLCQVLWLQKRCIKVALVTPDNDPPEAAFNIVGQWVRCLLLPSVNLEHRSSSIWRDRSAKLSLNLDLISRRNTSNALLFAQELSRVEALGLVTKARENGVAGGGSWTGFSESRETISSGHGMFGGFWQDTFCAFFILSRNIDQGQFRAIHFF